MPAGIFALVVVRIYEGDRKTAMRAIVATMLGSLFPAHIWLFLGLTVVALDKTVSGDVFCFA